MVQEFGSRVEKYQQRLCNTHFAEIKFSPAEFAVVCLLLLRGPQTPGELKAHSGRLHEFADPAEVDVDARIAAHARRRAVRRASTARAAAQGSRVRASLQRADRIRAAVASRPQARSAPRRGRTRWPRSKRASTKLEQELAALKKALGVAPRRRRSAE